MEYIPRNPEQPKSVVWEGHILRIRLEDGEFCELPSLVFTDENGETCLILNELNAELHMFVTEPEKNHLQIEEEDGNFQAWPLKQTDKLWRDLVYIDVPVRGKRSPDISTNRWHKENFIPIEEAEELAIEGLENYLDQVGEIADSLKEFNQE